MSPDNPNRPIGIWLLTGCFLIFCMVIIGGITRLTGSGLSITEWNLLMGTIPPMSESEWQIAFDKYKQIPQFHKVNYDFNLEDFKSIFWWEYIHRLLGRIIGMVFIIPFLWFYFKGMFDRKALRKMFFLFLLGGLQGFLGWFMVKSGLTELTSVSHIRLAIHLITAFFTFGFTFYYALEVLMDGKPIGKVPGFKRLINLLFILVTVQIIYGAFVAGLHAGNIFNSFPLMNGSFIPEGMFFLQPAWENLFSNQVNVQFIHRILAYIITVFALILFFKSRNINTNRVFKNGVNYLFFAVIVQFTLGVFTLLTGVNISLALLHQAGAFFLFSGCVYLIFLIRSRSREEGEKLFSN
jgi:cytochrome c oxidase assembly protein subunit 15